VNAQESGALGGLRTLTTALLLAGAVILLCGLVLAAGSVRLGYDFRESYLPAAQAVWDGGSPYVADAPLPYVYPPQLALALVPLTALPVDVAAFVAFLGALAALMGALAVLGVRDVRCYAAVVLWAPGWNALEMANVSAVLALALAVAWRYRDATWGTALALGLAISSKLYLWPLLLWTAATRRFAVTLLAISIGVGVTLAAWAVIGFAGLTSFPDQLDKIQFDDSYSIVGMAQALGYEPVVGRVVTALVGAALLGAVVFSGRRGNDLEAFTWSIAAALVLTPVVWQHYLVLLIVPLALARPRFSALWLLPILIWVSPRDQTNGEGLEPFIPTFVAAALVALLLIRRPPPRPQEERLVEASA
jgi:alpha-1,2-mannosyltransferase